MRAPTAGTDNASAQASIATAVAIGVVACVLADMTHEALGHLLVAWLAGVRVLSLSSVAIQTAGSSRVVAAAGTIANLVVGGLSLWIFNRTKARLKSNFFLWAFAAFNLLNSGYLVASALMRNGDWAAVIGGLSPAWVWRSALGIGGAGVYIVSVRWLARSIGRRVQHQEMALTDLRRVVICVYLAGGAILTIASVFNPISPYLILISGVGASFGLSAGFLAIPRLVRKSIPAGSQAPLGFIPLSIAWIGVSLVVGTTFVAVFGPGIHFAK